MPFVKVPKRIGHAEGGAQTPQLHALFSALARDLEALYIEAGLNPATRELRSYNEPQLLVEGTVIDEDADPVERALVVAYVKDTDDRASWTLTNEDGTYVLPVYRGSYDLAFSKAGHTIATTADQTYTEDTTGENKTLYRFLAVESTTPEAEDTVSPTDTIVIEFDKAITDVSGTGDILDNCEVAEWNTETEEWDEVAITNDSVAGAELTLTTDGNLTAEARVRVTIGWENTVVGPNAETLADDFVFEFEVGTS